MLNNTDNIESGKKLLSGFMDAAVPFVAYRLPGDVQGYAFSVGDIRSIDIIDFTPERFDGSFIVAPFENSNGSFALWPKEQVEMISLIGDEYSSEFASNFVLDKERESERHAYSKSFSFVKRALDHQVVDKVVLARKLEVSDVPESILPGVFEQLCKAYPNAFVYFFDHPEIGRWMGASPELFLEKKGTRLITVALAATRNSEFHSEDWNMKELEEQGLVSVFVDEVLSGYGITDYEKAGPEPVRAGEMVHLKTSYIFDASKLNSSIGQFIISLHPTPAVGGYPKKKALEIIRKAETFDRGFYSGFLGPVSKGGFRFFVNIRSMQLGEENAVLYLGGGITRDSREKNEWDETRLKARTLLLVLHSVKQKSCNESIHLR
jgi:isochorismate synthase